MRFYLLYGRAGHYATLVSLLLLILCGRINIAQAAPVGPPISQNVLNIYTLGAICDGTSHPLSGYYTTLSAAQVAFPGSSILNSTNWMTYEIDNAAINEALRLAGLQATANTGAGGPANAGSYYTQNEAQIVVGTAPSGQNGTCMINNPINATSIAGYASSAVGRPILFDARGATMFCEVGSALPCVDMTGAIGLDVYGLTLTTPTAMSSLIPQIGLLMGRNIGGNGSTYNTLEHLTISGVFLLAAYANLSAEDTTISGAVFANFATGSSTNRVYGVINDGTDTFFSICGVNGCPTTTVPTSFNTFECNQCKIIVSGTYAVPLWESYTHGHRWTGGYFRSTGTGNAQPCIVMNFANSSFNYLGYFDVHCENNTLGSIFDIEGETSTGTGLNATPTIDNLTYRDHVPSQSAGALPGSGAMFRMQAGVTSVKINNAHVEIGVFSGTSPTWFDTPSAYTVSGMLSASNSTGFTVPATLNGWTCLPACKPYGTAAGLPPSGIPVSIGTAWSSSSLPYVAPTAFTGAVTPVTAGDWTVTYSTNYAMTWTFGSEVCAKANLVFTPTFSTASGNLRFTLPSAVPPGMDMALQVSNLGNLTFPGGTGASPVMLAKSGQLFATLNFLLSNSTPQVLGVSNLVSGGTYTVQFNGCYY